MCASKGEKINKSHPEVRFKYEEKLDVPWKDAPRDAHGAPLPQTPEHVKDNEAMKVETPTKEQVEKVVRELGIPNDPHLDEDVKMMFC